MSNVRGLLKNDRISFIQLGGPTQQEIVIGVDPVGFSTLLIGNSQMLTSNTINYGNAAFFFDLGEKRLAIGGLSSATTTIDISGSINVSGNITGNGVGLITDGNLQSTTIGLGNIYLSTGGGGSGDVTRVNLISTTSGLGRIYASTAALTASSNWSRNLLQNTSTWISTVALFTSNTAQGVSSLHGIVSSGLSTLALFTSNTSNYFINNAAGPGVSSLLGELSTGLSTIALFTSNTSNYARNFLQDYSTGMSTVALFTSNTSNYFLNNAGGSGVSSLYGVVSSGLSTVALFTSNTSNYSRNLLQDYSTGLSTVALFTSNTSNYARNFLQNTSTWVSSVALFTSNTSNSVGNSIASTNIGLATYGYVCTTQLGFYLSTLPLTFTTSSLTVSSISFGQGDGYLILPEVQADSLSAPILQASTVISLTLSSFHLNTSSIQAYRYLGDGSLLTGLSAISSLSLQSTIRGLGTSGYVSSLSNVSMVSSQQVQASSFTGIFADSFTLVIADL